MPTANLIDLGTERALISTIFQHGKDSLIDANGIVDSSDFYFDLNRKIFDAFKALVDDPHCDKFDINVIKIKLKGMDVNVHSPKENEYLELISNNNFDKSNIQLFALQIKKLSLARGLQSKYQEAQSYLESLSGSETLSEIIQNAESKIVDYIGGATNENLINLTGDLQSYIQSKIDNEPLTQIGIPSGFPLWDEAIGGGLRRGTVNMVGARVKTGKSLLGMNIGLNVSKFNVPVLLLDSELTEQYQKDRMVSIGARVPLHYFETGKFKNFPDMVKKASSFADIQSKLPIYYESIAGMGYSEVANLIRRWIIKHVGVNDQGQANDCLVIYDYLKLSSGEGLTKVTPEYILLGLAMTELHNIAVKYMIPIFLLTQLNREGIDSEDGRAFSGSDRLSWLASSISIFKDKSEGDQELGCGWDFGNKKLLVVSTRYGPGMPVEGDYINLHGSLAPMVSKEQASGYIKEGFLFSDICRQNNSGYQQRTN